MNKPTQIIVPDPGLKEYGGHHPALMEAIRTAFANDSGVNVKVYSHKQIEQDIVQQASTSKISITPFFSSDFYQNFYSSLNYAESQTFIRSLSIEYSKLFSEIEGKTSEIDSEFVWFFHTINWQHAAALSLSIERLLRHTKNTHKIIICLMYSPLRFNKMGEQDRTRYLNFAIAFRRLINKSRIKLYAADFEIAEQYNSLLGTNIEIHPCFLLGKFANSTTNIKQKNRIVILYLGDAKVNKGFSDLPRLAEVLLAENNLSVATFVIQYTITNLNTELWDVDQKLKHIAKNNRRLKLIDSFLSQAELNAIFSKSFAIVFNYEPSIYSNQSSGVLWLASYFKLKVFTLTETWINREATRLETPCHMTTITDVAENLFQSDLKIRAESNAYMKLLFQDMNTWFHRQLKQW